jgi:hypothetical protein
MTEHTPIQPGRDDGRPAISGEKPVERAKSEIFVMGQRYEVPEGLTILRAFEWAGFRLKRGVGCRAVCEHGRCIGWRRHRLHYALACQTVVEPGWCWGDRFPHYGQATS